MFSSFYFWLSIAILTIILFMVLPETERNLPIIVIVALLIFGGYTLAPPTTYLLPVDRMAEGFQQSSVPYKVLQGRDIPGFDIERIGNINTIDECTKRCDANSQCQFVVAQPSTKGCWLKKTRPSNGFFTAWKSDNTFANAKPIPGDIPGFDLQPAQSISPEDCYNQCKNNPNCDWINYNNTTCWLKKAPALVDGFVGLKVSAPVPAPAPMNKNSLSMGSRLNQGEKLTSSNGKYIAIMQTDGNFCIYPGWCAYTQNWGQSLILETDGNVCIDGRGRRGRRWCASDHGATGLGAGPVYTLTMGDDGNLVVSSSKNGQTIYHWGVPQLPTPPPPPPTP
jgi:hypothetical protein